MAIPNILKIGAVVLVGIILAFVSGYIIFSYFSRGNEDNNVPSTLVEEVPSEEVEEDIEDGEGISPTSPLVAGVSDNSDSDGITTNTGMKGGVLGETNTTNDYSGVTPTNTYVQRNVIKHEDNESNDNDEVDYYDDEDTSNSKVYLYKNPEIDEHDDYFEYTYTFELNEDARERYKDGFKYSIDAGSCDSDDFRGTVDADDIEKKIEISVQIDKDNIDDENDLEESDYKLEGKRYIVRGDINIPQCDN